MSAKRTRDTTKPSTPDRALAKADDPSAMVDATLDEDERKLLAEALRRGEETRDVVEDAIVNFGRWLLVNVFDDKAAAALDKRTNNRVWRSLLARCGGPTLRMNDKTLYLALHIAAYDKRITDESWRRLEPGRKQFLLPLRNERLMREAAQHVTAMKLTLRATEDYAATLRAEKGDAPEARLTPKRFVARLQRTRSALQDKDFQKKAERLARELSKDERAGVTDEVRALRDWANTYLRLLREG